MNDLKITIVKNNWIKSSCMQKDKEIQQSANEAQNKTNETTTGRATNPETVQPS